MSDIRSVFIGNFSLLEKKVYSLKSYSQFYNELATYAGTQKVDVFAGYFLPNDPGFEFSLEQQVSDKINFTLSRGNSSTTKLLPFIWNNLVLFFKLTRFCLKKGNYFIFLPSPIGVWSVLILTLFRRQRSLGVYIGGHYGREQAFEKRKGNIKRSIKKLSAILVDKLVVYSIKKSDYVITSSYEYHHYYNEAGRVFLTPPMLNVGEMDLDHSFMESEERYITYCGELRHAKGVIDLLKAFIKLIKEEKLSGYKLKIIGTGQAYEELVNLAKTNDVGHLVVFCGQIKQQEKLKEELAASTLFVLPSYSEGFPRVAYECFTLGVPAVLTPVGGIPFLVKDKEHCLFAEPGNIDGLASKIYTILDDDNLRAKLSVHAKQLMKEEIFPRIKAYGSLSRLVLQKMNNPASPNSLPSPKRTKSNIEQNLSFLKTHK